MGSLYHLLRGLGNIEKEGVGRIKEGKEGMPCSPTLSLGHDLAVIPLDFSTAAINCARPAEHWPLQHPVTEREGNHKTPSKLQGYECS